MKTGVKVSDAMTLKPISIKPDATIEQCSKLMGKKHIGGLLVKIKGELAGLITEKDIVRNVIAKGKSPKKTKVSDIMVKKVITIEPDKDLFDALVILRDKGFRHLPVVKDGKLQGLLTMKDILRIEPSLFEILAERFEIRESARKPVKGPKYIEGECDSCGNYGQLYYKDDQYLCEECSDRVKGKGKPVKDIY